MSKIDEHKIIVSFVEKVFLAFLLAFFGMASFLFINFQKLIMLEIATISLGLLMTFVILFLSVRFLIKKFKQIGDLQ